MHPALRGLPFFACALMLCAQATPPASIPAGLETDWDIAIVLQEISGHYALLQPEFDRVDVQSWTAKGASETYAAQLKSCKEQAGAIATGAQSLTRNPQKLSLSIEVLFRIQALETMLISLEDGMRKYQSADGAQQLAAREAEIGANRDHLQTYILNLAAQREQDFDVMNREAQRCRAQLVTPPGKKK
jgi:hypothetical protein